MKTAESLQIRGLVNPDQSQPQPETPVINNDDSCIPLRKRKRRFSTAEVDHTQPFPHDIVNAVECSAPEEPTDLSLPKDNGIYISFYIFQSCLMLHLAILP